MQDPSTTADKAPAPNDYFLLESAALSQFRTLKNRKYFDGECAWVAEIVFTPKDKNQGVVRQSIGVIYQPCVAYDNSFLEPDKCQTVTSEAPLYLKEVLATAPPEVGLPAKPIVLEEEDKKDFDDFVSWAEQWFDHESPLFGEVFDSTKPSVKVANDLLKQHMALCRRAAEAKKPVAPVEPVVPEPSDPATVYRYRVEEAYKFNKIYGHEREILLEYLDVASEKALYRSSVYVYVVSGSWGMALSLIAEIFSRLGSLTGFVADTHKKHSLSRVKAWETNGVLTLASAFILRGLLETPHIEKSPVALLQSHVLVSDLKSVKNWMRSQFPANQ